MTRTGGRPLQLTGWFAGADRPVHIGVYQRRFPAGPYSRWDGQQWRQDGVSPAVAAADGAEPSRHQDVAWRGLAERPVQEPHQATASEAAGRNDADGAPDDAG